MSVAILAAAVFSFMLPYFVYLQTADGDHRASAARCGLHRARSAAAASDDGGLPAYDAWLLAAVWIAPIAALAILVVPLVRRREGAWTIARRVLPLVVLAMVTNGGLIRDRLDVRLPDAIVAPALLMVWLVYQAWRMPPRPVGLAARVVATIALLMTMRYAAVMGSVEEQLDRANVLAGLDRVPERLVSLVRDMDRPWAGRLVPSAVAGEMRPFFDYVPRCVPPDQRLLVAAWLPEIAVLSQRAFAGGQIWFMPGALKTPADHALVMRRLEHQRHSGACLSSSGVRRTGARVSRARRLHQGAFHRGRAVVAGWRGRGPSADGREASDGHGHKDRVAVLQTPVVCGF